MSETFKADFRDVVRVGGGSGGVSPIVSVEEIPGGHRIVIVDALGRKQFDVMDGAKGDPGADGKDGKDGGDYDDSALRTLIAALDANKADKIAIPTVPSNVSAFSNDADYQSGDDVAASITAALDDVDLEHFHVVTELPSVAQAKEYHEYVVVTYEPDGTTIASEAHYLFYNGAYHSRPTEISLDGYATEQYVNNLVKTPVPEGALFTDTIYDDTSMSNRVSNVEIALTHKSDLTINTNDDYGKVSFEGAGNVVSFTPNSTDNTIDYMAVRPGEYIEQKQIPTKDYVDGKTLAATGWGVARTGVATVTFNNSKWSSSATVDVSELGFSSGADYDVVAQPTTGGTATPWGNAVAFVNANKGASSFSVSSVTMEESLNGTVNIKYTIFAKGYGAVAYTGEIPTGGTTGQILTKRSDADGDYGWQNKLPSYVVDKPEGSNPVFGSVAQVGSFVNTDGTEYGIYEFYYKTSALPGADAIKEYPLTPLLDNYNIFDFIDATGVTSNGFLIGNGRTDGNNRVIAQQFSKNRKTIMLRAYGDYTGHTALLKIKFIGTKTV